MYVIAAKHLTSERDVEQCKRFICYSLDRAVEQIDPQMNPMGSITVIFDLRGGRPAAATWTSPMNHISQRSGRLPSCTVYRLIDPVCGVTLA